MARWTCDALSGQVPQRSQGRRKQIRCLRSRVVLMLTWRLLVARFHTSASQNRIWPAHGGAEPELEVAALSRAYARLDEALPRVRGCHSL